MARDAEQIDRALKRYYEDPPRRISRRPKTSARSWTRGCCKKRDLRDRWGHPIG